MRLPIFLAGLAILALGAAAMALLDKPASFGFLKDALTLGGAFLICGLFSLRNPWHGLIGAGVIALLGTSRGIENLAALPRVLFAPAGPGPTQLLESAAALICILLLIGVVRTLYAEKRRRLLADERDD